MIVCIGESLIDFVPVSEPEGAGLPHYHPVAGGCPFNCAIAAARLDGEVEFAGTISTDFFGDQIAARLEENRVGTTWTTRVDNPTTLAFVKKSPSGSARYAFYTISAADRALERSHLPDSFPDGALLQVGSISLIGDPEGSTILSIAEREAGARVVAFDPNVRDTLIADEADYRRRVDRALAAATVLKTSDEDLEWIFPGRSPDEAVRAAFDRGVRLVVLTRGAEGSTAYTADLTVHVPAREVEVSDTIGAGDSFLAALLVWMDEHEIRSAGAVAALSQAHLREVLEFASRVAAITCTRTGADPPRRGDLG